MVGKYVRLIDADLSVAEAHSTEFEPAPRIR